MAQWSDSRTSISLLDTLRETPEDSKAWERFVGRYRPMIYGWCREWGLQGADAEDVAQDVLARLTKNITQFRYDPSRCFRAWLKTVTQHAWSDSLADRLRGTDSRLVGKMELLEAQADLKRRFEESFDRELMEMAIRKVQLKVSAPAWEAFRLTALEGLSGAEASKRLSVSVASVFVSKHRVQKLLKEEIQSLKPPRKIEARLPLSPPNRSPAPPSREKNASAGPRPSLLVRSLGSEFWKYPGVHPP